MAHTFWQNSGQNHQCCVGRRCSSHSGGAILACQVRYSKACKSLGPETLRPAPFFAFSSRVCSYTTQWQLHSNREECNRQGKGHGDNVMPAQANSAVCLHGEMAVVFAGAMSDTPHLNTLLLLRNVVPRITGFTNPAKGRVAAGELLAGSCP